MSYFDTETNCTDKADFFSVAVSQCQNCGATSAQTDLTSIMTFAGQWATLCDDCAAADRQLEDQAGELVDQPSCSKRLQVIDADHASTFALVAALKAHDAECTACGSTRKTVQSDRLYVDPAAVCCDEGVA